MLTVVSVNSELVHFIRAMLIFFSSCFNCPRHARYGVLCFLQWGGGEIYHVMCWEKILCCAFRISVAKEKRADTLGWEGGWVRGGAHSLAAGRVSSTCFPSILCHDCLTRPGVSLGSPPLPTQALETVCSNQLLPVIVKPHPFVVVVIQRGCECDSSPLTCCT